MTTVEEEESPSDRSASSVLLTCPDTTDPPDRLGSVLAPRRRLAVPAVHVRQWLHHDLPPEQRAQPARRRSGGSSPTWATSWGPTSLSWNTFFALIQVAIGARTAVPADRAPGPRRVVLLGLRRLVLRGGPRADLHRIGFRPHRRAGVGVPLRTDRPDGVATIADTEAKSHGTTGRTWLLRRRARASGERPLRYLVWSGYWSLAAVLFLLPNNRTVTSVSSAITGMSSGEPSAYSHFLNSFGNQFGSGGVWTAWLLAIGSLIVGFGPLLFRRPTPFLAVGGLLAAFFWVSGQGLGGIFTGSGTDPNTGPLIILLALAMVPAALPDPSTWRSPFAPALSRYPVLVVGGVVGLVVALFLSAVYPVAAQESSSTAMSGMAGMSGTSMSGHERGDGGDGHMHEREQRRTEGRAGREEHPEHGHGGAGHRHEHERRRRQRRGRAQHHQGQLALHRSRAANGGGTGALGPGRERAYRHPHAHDWMRHGAHLLRTDQCGAVRPEHQSGGGALRVPRAPLSRPGMSRSHQRTTPSSTTSIQPLWRRTRRQEGRSTRSTSTASSSQRLLRARRCWRPRCTSCRQP